jgi:hypothetical protein
MIDLMKVGTGVGHTMKILPGGAMIGDDERTMMITAVTGDTVTSIKSPPMATGDTTNTVVMMTPKNANESPTEMIVETATVGRGDPRERMTSETTRRNTARIEIETGIGVKGSTVMITDTVVLVRRVAIERKTEKTDMRGVASERMTIEESAIDARENAAKEMSTDARESALLGRRTTSVVGDTGMIDARGSDTVAILAVVKERKTLVTPIYISIEEKTDGKFLKIIVVLVLINFSCGSLEHTLQNLR